MQRMVKRKTKPKLVIENPFLSLNTLSSVSSWSFPTVSAGVKISAQVLVPLRAAEEALQPPTEVKCPTHSKLCQSRVGQSLHLPEPVPPPTKECSQSSQAVHAVSAMKKHGWMDGPLEPAVSVFGSCVSEEAGRRSIPPVALQSVLDSVHFCTPINQSFSQNLDPTNVQRESLPTAAVSQAKGN